MTDTEELIARANDVANQGLLRELAAALATQAQEFERLKADKDGLFDAGLKIQDKMYAYRDRAQAAEALYEELKSTHIERTEAIRAEYLGQYLSLQAALATAEARVLMLETEINKIHGLAVAKLLK